MEKKTLFEEARKDKKLETRFKKRKEEVKAKRLELLRNKQAAKDKAEDKQYRKWIECVEDLEGVDVWLDKRTMEDQLSNANDWIILILKQMNYHRYVLKSKGDRGWFAKTSKGRGLSFEELKENMRQILKKNENVAETVPHTGEEEPADYTDVK